MGNISIQVVFGVFFKEERMRKQIRNLHLWVSVPFGLVIVIICLSGAMLVFEDEIAGVFRHDLYYVSKTGDKPLPVDRLMATVAGSLPDSVSVTGVTLFSDPQRSCLVSLSKPRRASLYVDPYTGEVKGKNERLAFFNCMFRMHRWLLDAPAEGGISVGKTIVGVSTLAFVLILLTGIVIWIPRSAKGLKNRLKVSTKQGWRRFCYDLHVSGGFYVAVFLLAMALTGLTWSFSWYRTGFYAVFGVEGQGAPAPREKQQQQAFRSSTRSTNADAGRGTDGSGGAVRQGDDNPEGRKKEDNRSGQQESTAFAHWQEVYETLESQNAGYRQMNISDGLATVSFDRIGNQRGADKYTFDPATGMIVGKTLYRDQHSSDKIRGWIYSVHTGSWGGMLTRILTFLAALVGATLPLTGYYLWIKRLSGKRRRRKVEG